MAVIRLRNSTAPSGKVVMVTISLKLMVDSALEDGEEKWFVVLSTDEVDINGDRISDVIINAAQPSDVVDDLIKEGLKTISAMVVWTDTASDSAAPVITYASHTNGTVGVSISRDVNFIIEDYLPSSGINIDSIRLTVNGIDVSDSLSIIGDPSRYDITWRPLRLLS